MKKSKIVYSNADDLLWIKRIKKNYKEMTKEQRLKALLFSDAIKYYRSENNESKT